MKMYTRKNKNTKKGSTEGTREEEGVRYADSNTAEHLLTADH